MPGLRPIAIIIPWFGQDLKGGAEQQTWQIATRLAQRGHAVEVLTTCCPSFYEDWATNTYAAGSRSVAGLTIRRFPVDGRDRSAFEQLNTYMVSLPQEIFRPGVCPVTEAQAALFVDENIQSEALLEHLRQHHSAYHCFLFLPYLYGPILSGLPLVAERAFLQPCLHDEVYAYLPAVEHVFRRAKGLLFNSEGEAALAAHLYGPGILPRSVIVGEGVELQPQAHRSVHLRATQPASWPLAEARFVLCLGRRDATKNVDLLIKAYQRFRHLHPTSGLQLVLAGPGPDSVDRSAGIVDLGLVEEDTKAALLRYCLALFQPSRNESYSRVIMEAWLSGRPVAAHRACLATALPVESTHGGWLAGTADEWAGLFAEVASASSQDLAQRGARGQSYAQVHAVWDAVLRRYEQQFGLVQPGMPQAVDLARRVTCRKRRLTAINQLLPSVSYGDAVSNHALWLRNMLCSLGYRSEIFAQHRDPRLAQQVRMFRGTVLPADTGLVYHHSIGSEVTQAAVAHQGPKCLIYHNITPARFFAEDLPELAKIVEAGRQDLPGLAHAFLLSVGDSAYNATELKQCGFTQPGVLPICIDPNNWNIRADPKRMAELQDGRTNLLFVGRFVPNKRQEDLVEAFAQYLSLDSTARLILVGPIEIGARYYERVMALVDRWGLNRHVCVTGLIDESALFAYYRTAHVFWSMSEHEGFCVPIAEAMWNDVPVLAYQSSAVPETMAEAGVVFRSKQDLLQLAGLAKVLAEDETVRRKILAAQRKRRSAFLPEAVQPKLEELVEKMEAEV